MSSELTIFCVKKFCTKITVKDCAGFTNAGGKPSHPLYNKSYTISNFKKAQDTPLANEKYLI